MSSSLPDCECLRCFVTKGDEHAFRELVDRHIQLVHGAAMRVLTDPDAAQEVAQTVFILLAKKAWRLTGHTELAGWLYRTAVLQARQYRRGHARRLEREHAAAAIASTMNEPDLSVAKLEPELDEAMLELRAHDREALVLRYFAGKSVREVGEALGIREDAAQKRLSKALDALASSLRRRGLRVGATAAVALALQSVAGNAAATIPAGLGSIVAAAAAATVPALSFPTVAISASKLMSLTKTQITIACTALALAPIGYEWQASASTRSENARLAAELRSYRRTVLEGEKRRLETERLIGSVQRKLDLAAPKTAIASDTPVSPSAQWSDDPEYVRLPRDIFAKVKFTDFDARTGRDGKPDPFPLPVLDLDGQPRPALEAALGLSPAEAEHLRQVCRDAFTEFQARMSQHSTTTNPDVANREAVRIDFTAFPQEGAEFQQRFRERLITVLGPERTELFWAQAEPVFRDVFNDFGANATAFQLMRSDTGLVEFYMHQPGSSQIGNVADLRGLRIPKPLRSTADAWLAVAAAQRMRTGGAQ